MPDQIGQTLLSQSTYQLEIISTSALSFRALMLSAMCDEWGDKDEDEEVLVTQD